ncbi:uncharacterized protein P884DRAFT_173083, partial [Thermothelomyces heterothallicus CBS 202.75]|uniref:uncharacterized protein n=1 Tax=Thermothelomyces heterothallicus CBS 202.75 TaxID=1149848 RepID=UPI0037437225
KLMVNHQPNQELSPHIRMVIYSLIATSQSERSLATLFGVSRHAIHHIIKLWKSNHTFDSRPRSGRLEVLSRSEKRYILLMVKKNRRLARKALINTVRKKVLPLTI